MPVPDRIVKIIINKLQILDHGSLIKVIPNVIAVTLSKQESDGALVVIIEYLRRAVRLCHGGYQRLVEPVFVRLCNLPVMICNALVNAPREHLNNTNTM